MKSFPQGSKCSTDGDCKENGFPCVILEVKWEIGAKAAEPFLQILCYYQEFLKQSAIDNPTSPLPCILLCLFGRFYILLAPRCLMLMICFQVHTLHLLARFTPTAQVSRYFQPFPFFGMPVTLECGRWPRVILELSRKPHKLLRCITNPFTSTDSLPILPTLTRLTLRRLLMARALDLNIWNRWWGN